MITKHMSLFIIAFTLLTYWVTTTNIRAESRFEKGFRGITWSSDKHDLPDLGLSEKAIKKIYSSGPASLLFMEGRGNLELQFDDIKLLSIFMQFTDQQFCGVDMIFKPEDRNTIASTLEAETGPGKAKDDQTLQWQTKDIEIDLTDRELIIRPLQCP